MDVQQIRGEIPALGNLIYMNTGYSGPPIRRAAEAMKDRIDLELLEGPASPNVQQSNREIRAQAAQAAAGLLNADPQDVLVTRNTTEGLNIVLSGLGWREGDEIITCNLEHGSVMGPSLMIGHRYGVKVRVVNLDPHDPKETILTKFEAAFTPRTKLLFVSHVEYSTGIRLPAPELAQLAHDKGALILLDGAQTGGHLFLDPPGQGYDFYSIPGQKWVLGYEGTGVLYINRDLIEQVHPSHTGGRGVLHPVDPDNIQPNSASMDKFTGGSVSVPLQAAFVEAAKFIQSVGVEEIEARNVALASRFKAQLWEMPHVQVNAPADPELSSGLVAFAVTGWEPPAVVTHLWEDHQIVVRQVPSPAAIRASLHFFNTEEEVDRLARAVAALA